MIIGFLDGWTIKNNTIYDDCDIIQVSVCESERGDEGSPVGIVQSSSDSYFLQCKFQQHVFIIMSQYITPICIYTEENTFTLVLLYTYHHRPFSLTTVYYIAVYSIH